MPGSGNSPKFTSSGAYYGDSLSLAATTATASGSTGATPTQTWHTLRLTLAVTAASGTTPSMTVTVETSSDASTWSTVGSFAAKTAVSSERKAFVGLDRFVRVSWAITGTTPSFTFSVTGEAL